MSTVPGITDLAVFNSLGQPTVQHRHRPGARRALRPQPRRHQRDDCRRRSAARPPAISTKTAATAISRSWCGWRREYRESLDAIRHITIGAPNPSGSGIVPIPLTDVANVRLVSGASFIYRENQERYIPIKFSVRGRDLGGAVLEAQQQDRQRGPAARRLSPRMGRRVRRACRTRSGASRSSCRSASR